MNTHEMVRAMARILAAAAAAALFALAPASLAGEEHVRMTIIHTNDMHGNLQPREMGKDRAPTGGIARIAALAQRMRLAAAADGSHVVLLDAGDVYSGTPEGNTTKGRLCFEMMNLAGYEMACVGNHEFDDGLANLRELAGIAKFPLLAANLRDKGTDDRPAFALSYVIREFGGVKVAFAGVITTETATISGGGSEVDFADEAAALRNCDSEARGRGAAFTVAVTHVGLDRDKELTDLVPGVPLFIGGHSHSFLERGWKNPKTGAWVAQAGSGASHAGIVEIVYDTQRKELSSVKVSMVTLSGESMPEHPEVKDALDAASGKIRAAMDVIVGRIETGMDRGGRRYSGKSSPLGNLIADVMRETAGSDVAFHNRTGIRDELKAGDVTMRDIYRVCPFGNTIVSMDLTGSEILAMLEYALSEGNRYLLEVSGMEVAYDPSAAVGKRVTGATIGGAPVDPDKTYRVATSNFIADGGDGHVAFTKGRNRKDSGVLDRDAVAKKIASATPFRAEYTNRIIPK